MKFPRLLTASFLFLAACSSSTSTVTLKGSDGTAGSESALFSGLASGTIDASSLKFKVYKFAVSLSEECTSPITIFTSASGEEKNIASNPTFGTGTLSNDTYPCVMIEVSKKIKTKSATTTGFCTAGEEFSDVICNDGQESQTIGGSSVTCSGGAGNDQKVTIFMTTLSSGAGGTRALLPPTSSTDTASAIELTAPFVVEGDLTGTLKVDLRNFLDSGAGVCFTSPPPFTFE